MYRLAFAAAVLCATLTSPVFAKDIEPALHLVHAGPAREVALTFDACSGAVDHRILDVLLNERIPATIFVTSRWLKRNAETVAVLKAHPDLFEIENHGDHHIPAVTDTPQVFGIASAGSLEAVRAEVDGGAQSIRRVFAITPHWFRGATARYSTDAATAIEAEGYRIAGYSLNADMGASLPAASVAKRLSGAKSGDVVIAHINQPTRSAGAGVAAGILGLIQAGAVFVRLDATESEPATVAPSAARHPAF